MSENENETIPAFLTRMGITCNAVRIPTRPDLGPQTAEEKRWDDTASHWMVTFKRYQKGAPSLVMSTCYSMGSAHHGNPKSGEVMDSLLSDAESWDNARKVGASAPDVDTFSRDLGYDDDGSADRYAPGPKRERLSLIQRADRVRRIFDACAEAYRKLSEFLGPEGFDALRRCERM